MKHLILLFFALAAISFSFAQTSDEPRSTKEMLAAIEGQYTIDDNNNVTYVRIIETPEFTADQIYERALNYFIYNYGNGKSVIQVQDKDQYVLVGKGVFDGVYKSYSFAPQIDVWHILRIDVKEGKARAIISLTEYETTKKNGYGQTQPSTFVNLSDTYPINPKGSNKAVMTESFYKTIQAAVASLDKLEGAIKSGNTSSTIENVDW